MPQLAQQVSQAAFDVAVERMTTLHAAHQAFVFGPDGAPFWAQFAPTPAELELLEAALTALEAREAEPAPLTARDASGQFTAMVLDAERSLFAVLLTKAPARLPGEARAAREAPGLLLRRRART
jgi:hypothetical protein